MVIAIIAILAAMLLPALQKAQKKAEGAVCINNQKQILLATKMYADDNRRFVYTYTHSDTGPGYTPRLPWYVYLISYTKTRDVYICPTESGNPVVWMDDTTRNNYPSTYGVNFPLGGHHLWRGIKPSGVQQPSTTVYMSDGGVQSVDSDDPAVAANERSKSKPGCWILQDPRVNGCTSCSTNPDDPNWGGPNLRHLGRSNVGFVDGHVEAMRNTWFYGNTPWLDPNRGGP